MTSIICQVRIQRGGGRTPTPFCAKFFKKSPKLFILSVLDGFTRLPSGGVGVDYAQLLKKRVGHYHDKYYMSGADPEGGGARPPLFAPNSLKSPLNLEGGPAQQPPAPPLFSNPGSAPACSGLRDKSMGLRVNLGLQLHPPI